MSINISRKLSEFEVKNIFFNNTIKNKIIKGTNSLFTGINVKHGGVLLNNICLVFTVKNPIVDKMQYDSEKYRCFVYDTKGIEILKNIEVLEETILDYYCLFRNKSFEKIHTLINNENNAYCFKYYSNKKYVEPDNKLSIINRYCISNRNLSNADNNSISFAIKISGVWENNNTIGISYKICCI